MTTRKKLPSKKSMMVSYTCKASPNWNIRMERQKNKKIQCIFHGICHSGTDTRNAVHHWCMVDTFEIAIYFFDDNQQKKKGHSNQ